jgi:hypothetical protein
MGGDNVSRRIVMGSRRMENAYEDQSRHLQEITNSRRINMDIPDSK